MHTLLTVTSAGVVLAAGVEGVARAWMNRAPGSVASRANALVLLVLGMTIAAGLALLVSGHRPREGLHFVYAVLAFAALPLGTWFARNTTPRWQGLSTALAASVALVLLLRLATTG